MLGHKTRSNVQLLISINNSFILLQILQNCIGLFYSSTAYPWTFQRQLWDILYINCGPTCAMLTTPSARVLYPSMVRFLYRFRLCNNIRSLLPSLLRKCGYWRANCNSSSVSSMPPVGIAISLDRKVLLELCIFTAMLMDVRSEPSGRSITKRVSVKEHSLKKEHNKSIAR